MPTQLPSHVSVTQTSSEQREHRQNHRHLALRATCPGLPRGSPSSPTPSCARQRQVSPFPAHRLEIFAILMTPTCLEHTNEIITETRPFTGISGKLPLNKLTKFLTSPHNIYLFFPCYHHLQPPCCPAKQRKALCPKPAARSASVLRWLR